ncbi:hypothetical protein [Pseudooctadecabacter jejudonensis]|uniref:Transposase IS200-like domain-containing protein n=1 Tax=Pseudooctadecabacter jejudonensis TaxID=1391910 RepID=A0A1Y5SU38_9RHOB|nr:hypothetical protein [Pseudooctadecabacter jejudonensis]SLN45103.1 hypothetical protein PSJ8397_02352 [Pseudooctadecabacter jejudonensis]
MDAPQAQPVAMNFTLADLSSDLLLREVCLLRDCVAVARAQWRFEIDAAVVLPAQMQMLAVFQTGAFGVRQAMAVIRQTFADHVGRDGTMWDGPIKYREVPQEAVPVRRAFIEAAPVRMGLVSDPSDWAYSSAHRLVPQARALGVNVA